MQLSACLIVPASLPAQDGGSPRNHLMDEIDALLDALWKAAINGDFEAAIFLQMFAPWAASLVSGAR
jgi:hypothetical protein